MTALTLTIAQAIGVSQGQGLELVDAERLLLHVLDRDPQGRAWLRAHASDELTPEQGNRFSAACSRRANGEPLAYIVGERGFYGLTLAVDARVLDPRPDTETLVDWALEILRDVQHPKVADLGTGSGAIALALQHQRPDASVVAVDASEDALSVARINAQRLNLPVRFLLGSWLSPLATHTHAKGFHLIVSNPPYIAQGDPHMAALRHEPHQALVSGPDGLNDIRLIVEQAPRHLRSDSWLLLEHGHDQAQAVQTLMLTRGFDGVQSRNDLAGIARCTGGIWRGASNAG